MKYDRESRDRELREQLEELSQQDEDGQIDNLSSWMVW